MATPQNGVITLKDIRGRVTFWNGYCSDAAGKVTWSRAAKAASTDNDFFIAEEACLIKDWVTASALATETTLNIYRNDVPTGFVIPTAVYNAAILNRPPLDIPLMRGDKVAIVQS